MCTKKFMRQSKYLDKIKLYQSILADSNLKILRVIEAKGRAGMLAYKGSITHLKPLTKSILFRKDKLKIRLTKFPTQYNQIFLFKYCITQN